MLLLYEPFIITKAFFDCGKVVLAYRILDKKCSLRSCFSP